MSGIAQAIVNDPQLIIVDEPTAGLDPEERIRFRNLLTQLGRDRTVLLSTHIVEDIAQSCRQVAVQAKGRLIFTGTVSDLAQQARGVVWQVRREVGEAPPEDVQIIGMMHSGEHIDYRVIGQPSLKDAAQAVDPTLEDGYMWLMHRQSETSSAVS